MYEEKQGEYMSSLGQEIDNNYLPLEIAREDLFESN